MCMRAGEVEPVLHICSCVVHCTHVRMSERLVLWILHNTGVNKEARNQFWLTQQGLSLNMLKTSSPHVLLPLLIYVIVTCGHTAIILKLQMDTRYVKTNN